MAGYSGNFTRQGAFPLLQPCAGGAGDIDCIREVNLNKHLSKPGFAGIAARMERNSSKTLPTLTRLGSVLVILSSQIFGVRFHRISGGKYGEPSPILPVFSSDGGDITPRRCNGTETPYWVGERGKKSGGGRVINRG